TPHHTPHDTGLATEPAHPIAVTQNDDAGAALLILLGEELPAEDRPSAESREVPPRDTQAIDSFGYVARVDAEPHVGRDRQGLEYAAVVLEVPELGVADGQVTPVAPV